MNSLASAMNLNRFSTYNLACDLKDQIQEVERNWDADLEQLERAKRSRNDMQERVRVLQILLNQDRETTADLERTLQETKLEFEIPIWDTTFDSYASYEGTSSLSSVSVYSDADFCLVYNQSAAPDADVLDNRPSSTALAAKRDCSGSNLVLPARIGETVPKPTRSAQWKQLIASFLPNTKVQRSPRTSQGTPPVLHPITSAGSSISRPKRRSSAQSSSSRSFGSSGSTGMNDWRGTAEAAGGRFTRRKTRSGMSDTVGHVDDT